MQTSFSRYFGCLSALVVGIIAVMLATLAFSAVTSYRGDSRGLLFFRSPKAILNSVMEQWPTVWSHSFVGDEWHLSPQFIADFHVSFSDGGVCGQLKADCPGCPTTWHLWFARLLFNTLGEVWYTRCKAYNPEVSWLGGLPTVDGFLPIAVVLSDLLFMYGVVNIFYFFTSITSKISDTIGLLLLIPVLGVQMYNTLFLAIGSLYAAVVTRRKSMMCLFLVIFMVWLLFTALHGRNVKSLEEAYQDTVNLDPIGLSCKTLASEYSAAGVPLAWVYSFHIFCDLRRYDIFAQLIDYCRLLIVSSLIIIYALFSPVVHYIIKSHGIQQLHAALSLAVLFRTVFKAILESLLLADYRVKKLRYNIRSAPPPGPSKLLPGRGHTHSEAYIERGSSNAYLANLIKHVAPECSYFSVGAGNDTYDGVDKIFTPKSEDRDSWVSSALIDISIYFITWFSVLFRPYWLLFKNSDYYMNVTYFLCSGKPIAICTHDFSTPGGKFPNSTYSFDDNIMSMVVSGGGRYVHRVNRFDTDIIATRNMITPWFSYICRLVLMLLGIDLVFIYDVHYFTYESYTYVIMTPNRVFNVHNHPNLEFEEYDKTIENSYVNKGIKINAQLVQKTVQIGKEKNEQRILYATFANCDKVYQISWTAFCHNALNISLHGDVYKTHNVFQNMTNVHSEPDAAVMRDLMMLLAPYSKELFARLYVQSTHAEYLAKLNNEDVPYVSSDTSGEPPDLDSPPDLTNPFTKSTTKNEARLNKKLYASWLTDKIDNFSSFHRSVGQLVADYVPAMRQIFPLLVPMPIAAPCRTAGADLDAYQGRLLGVQSDTTEFRKSDVDWRVIDSIIRALFPQRLQPMSFEDLEVYVRTKPNLLKRYNEYMETYGFTDDIDNVAQGIKNFVKVELQLKDPSDTSYRNITNDSAPLVIEMSRFTKPMSQHLAATRRGYAFGQSSADLGKHINDLANKHDDVVETDYSSFDGTQNTLTCRIETLIYQTVFKDNERILKCKAKSYCANVQGEGFQYSTYGSRHSGAADTSLMNTLVNIIVTTYSRLKYWEAQGGVIDPSVNDINAMIDMSIAGGDDGLAFCMDENQCKHYEETAKLFGLILKAKRKSTHLPLNMLARIYPSPRVSPGSGVDIKRMLGKLTHSGLKYDQLTALALKISGYITTDYATPLVQQWCDELIRLLQPLVDKELVPTLNASNDVAYSARLGQPIPTTLETEYLHANDPIAVEAMQQSLEQMKQCKTLFEWKPTCFFAPDVGDYNNNNYTSKLHNKATTKLQQYNEYGEKFKDLPHLMQLRMMNSSITNKLTTYVTAQKPTSILDVSGCPDLIQEYYKKLNVKMFYEKTTQPVDLMVINIDRTSQKYNNTLSALIKNLAMGQRVFIHTTYSFVTSYQFFISGYGLVAECTGNSSAIITGVKSAPVKPKMPKTSDATKPAPPHATAPQPRHFNSFKDPILKPVSENILNKPHKPKQLSTNKPTQSKPKPTSQ